MSAYYSSSSLFETVSNSYVIANAHYEGYESIKFTGNNYNYGGLSLTAPLVELKNVFLKMVPNIILISADVLHVDSVHYEPQLYYIKAKEIHYDRSSKKSEWLSKALSNLKPDKSGYYTLQNFNPEDHSEVRFDPGGNIYLKSSGSINYSCPSNIKEYLAQFQSQHCLLGSNPRFNPLWRSTDVDTDSDIEFGSKIINSLTSANSLGFEKLLGKVESKKAASKTSEEDFEIILEKMRAILAEQLKDI